MVAVKLVMHPRSLHPLQAAMAYRLRLDDEMPWAQIVMSIVNLSGEEPSVTAVREAVERVEAQQETGVAPQLKYANCGIPAVIFSTQTFYDAVMYISQIS